MLRITWAGDASAFPEVMFKRAMRPIKRRVVREDIVTAYTNGQVTLRSNRDKIGYHEATDLSTYQGVEPGDFVVHGLDILRGSVGVSDSLGAISPVCTVCGPSPHVDGRFIAYAMRAQSWSGFPKALARGIREGGADFRRWETLGELPVPCPALDEQRRIADFLDAETSRIDRLIALRQRQQVLALEQFRAVLAAETLDREVGWVTRLKYLFEFERNGLWGDEPQGDDDDVPVVRVADFDRDNFRVGRFETVRNVPSHLKRRRLLQRGDVLLEKSGGTADKPVGCAVIFDGQGPAICSNFVAALRPITEVNSTYVGYLMAAHYQTRRNAPFVTQTTGIQNLDSGAYLGLNVVMPSRVEQVESVRRIESAREATATALRLHKRHAALLAELRMATVTVGVTGHLGVAPVNGVA